MSVQPENPLWPPKYYTVSNPPSRPADSLARVGRLDEAGELLVGRLVAVIKSSSEAEAFGGALRAAVTQAVYCAGGEERAYLRSKLGKLEACSEVDGSAQRSCTKKVADAVKGLLGEKVRFQSQVGVHEYHHGEPCGRFARHGVTALKPDRGISPTGGQIGLLPASGFEELASDVDRPLSAWKIERALLLELGPFQAVDIAGFEAPLPGFLDCRGVDARTYALCHVTNDAVTRFYQSSVNETLTEPHLLRAYQTILQDYKSRIEGAARRFVATKPPMDAYQVDDMDRGILLLAKEACLGSLPINKARDSILDEAAFHRNRWIQLLKQVFMDCVHEVEHRQLRPEEKVVALKQKVLNSIATANLQRAHLPAQLRPWVQRELDRNAPCTREALQAWNSGRETEAEVQLRWVSPKLLARFERVLCQIWERSEVSRVLLRYFSQGDVRR